MGDVKLVVVNAYSNRAEAELAKGALEAAGIPAMSQADTVGGMREHIAWSGAGFQILVREEDVAAAREVLDTAFEGNFDEAGGDSDEASGDSRSRWRRFT